VARAYAQARCWCTIADNYGTSRDHKKAVADMEVPEDPEELEGLALPEDFEIPREFKERFGLLEKRFAPPNKRRRKFQST